MVAAAALSLLALSARADTAGEPPLRDLRWLAAGADAVAESTMAPAECLAKGRQTLAVEVGRAAFRSPLLLGGQASRAGLSCESCHRNGRGHPQFAFPGISGAPGTADVTASLFSTHRGDGVDNPRPIPDLGGPKAGLKIDQRTRSPALKAFIHGLVVEEFDGEEPPPAVLDGLVAYVRALSPDHCRSAATPLRVADLAEDARRAVRAARRALAARDQATAAVMLEAARAPLGRLDERYAAPELAADRAAIRAASLDLGAALASLRAGGRDTDQRLSVWLAQSAAWADQLARGEPRSLFDRDRLRAAINAPG